MSAICQLCDDVVNKMAYVTVATAMRKPGETAFILIHRLVHGTGTPEVVAMEVIMSFDIVLVFCKFDTQELQVAQGQIWLGIVPLCKLQLVAASCSY